MFVEYSCRQGHTYITVVGASVRSQVTGVDVLETRSCANRRTKEENVIDHVEKKNQLLCKHEREQGCLGQSYRFGQFSEKPSALSIVTVLL